MKRAFSLFGLLLLLIPLLRLISFEKRLEAVDSAPKLVSTLMSISSGLTCGFFGLLVLGFVCDAGQDFRSNTLFISMAAIGLAWCFFYPAGWLLGGPLIAYAVGRRFGPAPLPDATQNARTQ
jgi:hypothetical protein